MNDFWNLRTLYNFIITADRENMTTAASELFLTQPALSHQIHKIEMDLGVSLFYRENKGLKLTDEGKAFYDKCKELLDAHDRFNTDVYHLGKSVVGSLRIGYSKASERFMFGANQTFLTKYPDIQMRAIRQSVSRVVEMLETKFLDGAFVHGEDLASANAQIRSTFLFSLPYMLLVSTRNPIAKLDTVDFSELRDQYFVLPRRNIHPEKVDAFMGYCRDNGFVPNVRNSYFKLSDYIMEIVTYPNSVSVLPYIQSVEEEKKGLVKYVPLTGYKETDDIYFAWNAGSPASSLQLYIDTIKKYAVEGTVSAL